ncbi:hypothetical protein AWZ03_014297 [Drosophila navojoa]|uniref:Uncharacterized protein n=1 Tax=Drosophila navojoa TaxID=7232 RepID=A0A484ASB9_DRONA|nr:hypothetical protein AWZ03_014297 [Drosophila navojoa]
MGDIISYFSEQAGATRQQAAGTRQEAGGWRQEAAGRQLKKLPLKQTSKRVTRAAKAAAAVIGIASSERGNTQHARSNNIDNAVFICNIDNMP